MAAGTLSEFLNSLTVEGDLGQKRPDGSVTCHACGHRCVIRPGLRGICKVRFNAGGRLRVPWGYVGALQCDPTEKKPFFHVLPGSRTLTFGMLGCDMRCPYCQNWVTSQALRDPASELHGPRPMLVTPEQLIAVARRQGADLIGSSYNEPLITSEWAVAIFREAERASLKSVYVSNGNATAEVLDYIRPHVVAYKVDLKTMSDRNYRRLGAVLDNVLDGIRMVYARGFWIEVVTLVIPGFNDSDGELRDAARFLVSLSPDIPWHVTAFHRDYRMTEPNDTPARTLIHAAEIGRTTGLRYVYAGNLPGQAGRFEHTFCPTCQRALIERSGHRILSYHLTPHGTCPRCGMRIPGLWRDGPQTARLGEPAEPRLAYGYTPRVRRASHRQAGL